MIATLVAPAAGAQHLIYLEGSTEGTLCKVLEETPEYVLVRIPSALVLRIESTLPANQPADETALVQSVGPLVPPEDSGGTVSLKTQIMEELYEEMTAQRQQVTGSAAGEILWNDEPLAGCRVRIRQTGGAQHLNSARRTHVTLETLTDEDGVYRFEDLAPGHYRLSWVPPNGTHWVRRLRLEPDFLVKLGQSTEVEPLDIRAGALN